jgi:putative hydrolase of HD superfamily
MNPLQKITNFFFELNEAKRTPRSGWQRLGIEFPESIAEHSCCCAQIAYIIALLEGVDAERAALLALFHDIGEIRTGDNNWVGRIYLDKRDTEARAMTAQMKSMPLNSALTELLEEEFNKTTKEAIVAKDADILELVIQSRAYIATGCKGAQIFIDSNTPNLKTETAKRLLPLIEKTNLEDWWLQIPEIKEIAEKLYPQKDKN